MITVEHICKSFRVARREAGMKAAVRSLWKREYKVIQALDDISFTIPDGEMVGYIGPNGAGKSSTIKVLSGILTPDSGRCEVNGRCPWRERTAHVQEIGVVFGQRSQLWWDVPVIDSFELLRDIYRVPEAEYRRNFEGLVTLLKLEDIVRTPTRQLSLGQRMRCEIAASLLHSPKVLFLDEPTIGLDAVSKLAVRSFILDLNRRRGTTVILTTHDMQDIEALARRILLIGKGKILLDGQLEDLKRHFSGGKTIRLQYTGEMPPLCGGLKLLPESVGGQAALELDTVQLSAADAIRWLSERVEVQDLSVEEMPIDEIVAGLYREYQI